MNNDVTEWYLSKAQLNKKKHAGLTFDEAQQVFDDPFYLEKYDVTHSTIEEERYQVLGRVKSQLVVFVVYTPKNGKKRIISARPALRREREMYYEKIKHLTNNG